MRAAAVEALGVAAELDDHARRRRERGVGAPSEPGGPRGVERGAVAIVVVEMQAGRVQPLGDREARARQVSPRQRRQPRAADGRSNLVDADVRVAFLEHRATEERRDRHLMPGTDVVHRLGLRIDEAERESRLGIDPLDQIVEITAADRGEPRSLAAGDRAFAEEGRAGAAQAGASAELVAAAFARRQADLGAHLAARALRIAAREQGHAAQRLAVDHRDRPAVGDAVDGVHQIPRRDAVHDQADVAERVAAHGELAVEVVGRRGRRQGLHRPQRIVEHCAAQGFELAAVERRACPGPNRTRVGVNPTQSRARYTRRRLPTAGSSCPAARPRPRYRCAAARTR